MSGAASESWIPSTRADSGRGFGLDHLPIGSFAAEGRGRRLGIRIGDEVLDLSRAEEAGLFSSLGEHERMTLREPVLNALLALGSHAWSRVWDRTRELLSAPCGTLREHPDRGSIMLPVWGVSMRVPAHIGDYTDFYASLHHATNVGSMFRPDNPLLPNWKHVPIGYHGRGSSIVPTGTPVRRPSGQRKPPDATEPLFGPSQSMDHELELGFLVGPGNAQGQPLTMDEASQRIFGVMLVNDWSARDIQAWEYQPLGPFLAKNFATSVAGWVTPISALNAAKRPGPPRSAGDPAPMPYLSSPSDWGLDIDVQVWIQSALMREKGMAAVQLSSGNYGDMFWTPSQMLAHHASGGCNMQPGDLFASGTISGPTKGSRGCMLELTWRGAEPMALPDGTERKFLLDGDEVTLRGSAPGCAGGRLSLGECTGRIEPACAANG
ncbi:MAG: fumarylacetoacetase [Planctomycetota bacterium]|nr:fumarylacetoacetase [Planctomycetota bacterium]MDA1106567.1 fumarylacetoacetase [Planctomycetota bacterium]